MELKVSLIVAMAANGVIGDNNKLPWHLPEDLAYFKEKTLNKPIIMGSKTHEAIGRPLPERLNIVLSSRPSTDFHPNVVVANSISEALALAVSSLETMRQFVPTHYTPSNEVMIIGGGEVYKQFEHVVTRMYITRIMKEFEGDTKFSYDSSKWETTKADLRQGKEFDYSFNILERL